MFGSYKHDLSDTITLHFLNINEYSVDLKNYIESNIFHIWNGDNEIIESNEDIEITKKELLNLLNNKTDEQIIGIVSEFICHLYLRQNSFLQHFLFRNLEEKGMKKGFDGLYLLNDEFFLYESKSTLETTLSATHNSNISEAYNDVKKKVEGVNITNDPWRNAYNHASHRSIDYNDTVSKTLKKLSNEYVQEKYGKVESYNIMPSSTIYLGARYCSIENEELKTKIENLVKGYKFKHLNVICVNKSSVKHFIDYLNE